VTDPGHTAVSQLNKIELVKQLQEMKKQVEELQKQTSYAFNTMNKLGEMAAGASSPNYLMRQAQRAASCAIPELNNLSLPDGYTGSFATICEASKSVRELVLPSEEPELRDGLQLTDREQVEAVRGRRSSLHEDATIASLATSQSVLQTQGDSASAGEELISESNQALTIDALLRVQVKGQAALLTKLGSIELLMAQQVRLLSTREAQSLRTTVDVHHEPVSNQ
jgi:hypothetical protein